MRGIVGEVTAGSLGSGDVLLANQEVGEGVEVQLASAGIGGESSHCLKSLCGANITGP